MSDLRAALLEDFKCNILAVRQSHDENCSQLLTGEEATDDKLHRKHLALLHDDCIGVWHGKQSIGDNVLSLLHPPSASFI